MTLMHVNSTLYVPLFRLLFDYGASYLIIETTFDFYNQVDANLLTT